MAIKLKPIIPDMSAVGKVDAVPTFRISVPQSVQRFQVTTPRVTPEIKVTADMAPQSAPTVRVPAFIQNIPQINPRLSTAYRRVADIVTEAPATVKGPATLPKRILSSILGYNDYVRPMQQLWSGVRKIRQTGLRNIIAAKKNTATRILKSKYRTKHLQNILKKGLKSNARRLLKTMPGTAGRTTLRLAALGALQPLVAPTQQMQNDAWYARLGHGALDSGKAIYNAASRTPYMLLGVLNRLRTDARILANNITGNSQNNQQVYKQGAQTAQYLYGKANSDVFERRNPGILNTIAENITPSVIRSSVNAATDPVRLLLPGRLGAISTLTDAVSASAPVVQQMVRSRAADAIVDPVLAPAQFALNSPLRSLRQAIGMQRSKATDDMIFGMNYARNIPVVQNAIRLKPADFKQELDSAIAKYNPQFEVNGSTLHLTGYPQQQGQSDADAIRRRRLATIANIFPAAVAPDITSIQDAVQKNLPRITGNLKNQASAIVQDVILRGAWKSQAQLQQTLMRRLNQAGVQTVDQQVRAIVEDLVSKAEATRYFKQRTLPRFKARAVPSSSKAMQDAAYAYYAYDMPGMTPRQLQTTISGQLGRLRSKYNAQ